MGFRKTGDWKRMSRALTPAAFTPVLERNIGSAIGRGAHLIQKAAREGIRAGIPPPNAALTIVLKGSRQPLVDHGDLFGAIAVKQVNWRSAFIGVLRTSPEVNLATTLHEGVAIQVTDKMRAMFTLLYRAGQGHVSPATLRGRAAELWARAPGNHWRPLRSTTSVIVIPPRRFMRRAFRDRATKSRIRQLFAEAVKRSFAEMARR